MGLHEGTGEPMSILKIKSRASNRKEGREEDGAQSGRSGYLSRWREIEEKT